MQADCDPHDFRPPDPEREGASLNVKAKETDPLLPARSSGSGCLLCPSGLIDWLHILEENFGRKLLILLFCCQHLLKGFVDSFTAQAAPYLYKSYAVPAPQRQIYDGVTMLPWAMKPIIGLVSDLVPIRGYNKAPYILMTSVTGLLSFLVVGGLPRAAISVTPVVVCLCLQSMQKSTCDLLSEAKYAEKMQLCPEHGPSLLTYVWFGISIGGMVAVMSSGFVIESFGPKPAFLISAVPAGAVLIPVAMGYMEESQASQKDIDEARKSFFEQKEACFLCILMFGVTVGLTCLGLAYSDPVANGMFSLAAGCVVLVGFSLVLSPIVAKFNAFSLIQTALALNISGASFYFYTDTPDEYPEGPHFTPFFYNSVLMTVGQIFSLIGIFMYQRCFRHWRYRHLFIMTNIAFSALCIPDIILFKRINLRLGIPDRVFVLGSQVLQETINQWQWMPQVVILSYLCPKGMEATMYALLAGAHNLGNTISACTGAMLLHWLDCKPTGEIGESKSFEKLWIASAISTALPLLTVLALFWLIPDAKQNERLISEERYDATSGSLWRCFTKAWQLTPSPGTRVTE